MRRGRLAVIAMSSILAVFALPAAVAHELVGATGNTGCNQLNIHQSDDGTIQYRASGLTIANYNQTVWVMDNVVGPTDLNKSLVPSGGDFIYFDDAYTDQCGFNWVSTQYGPGVQAHARCMKLISNMCDTHHMYFSTIYTDSGSGLDTGTRRRLICHETGHSIGIQHNDHTLSTLDSCMKNPASTGVNGFSDHEINDMIHLVW